MHLFSKIKEFSVKNRNKDKFQHKSKTQLKTVSVLFFYFLCSFGILTSDNFTEEIVFGRWDDST